MVNLKILNNTFYYNEETQTAIYSIDVTKDWGIKTVKIKYAHGDYNCLCNTEFTGKRATELCSE